MAKHSIALAEADQQVSQSLFQTFSALYETYSSADPQQQLTSLQQQYAYAAPPQQPQYPYAQQLPQYAAPMPAQAVAPPVQQQAAAAPAPVPAVLPGAVGNIPYVYNDKQYLPSAAPAAGFPIVWLFADNKTPDMLYFGYQSADGVMHVYNEIKPHSVTRQQAFANEYWTILAADKRTVAVQPFKITQVWATADCVCVYVCVLHMYLVCDVRADRYGQRLVVCVYVCVLHTCIWYVM